jgi:phage tail sheath protein FI
VPATLTRGIYVEEAPRGERRIATPETTLTAFVGRTLRGPVDEPVTVTSMDEFGRTFGGPWSDSPMWSCVGDYFENGGRAALIVRVINGGSRARLTLPAADRGLQLEAQSPGAHEWLRASIDYDNIDVADGQSFNLVLQRVRGPGSERVVAQEIYARLSVDPSSGRFAADALLESNLVRIRGPVPAVRPDRTVGAGPLSPVEWVEAERPGTDGGPLTNYDIIGSETEASGIFALNKVPDVHMVCIPAPDPENGLGPAALLAATRLCRQLRAMLVLDPPRRCDSAESITEYLEALNFNNENVVMTFPWIIGGEGAERPDEPRPGCGAIAGTLARGDSGRDAWTPWSDAPRLLRGGARPALAISPIDAERLNAQGVNVLRETAAGRVLVLGERTMAGSDCAIAAYRSIRTRRLALLVEQALRHGTRWVVFENPGPELRERVRTQVEAFLGQLEVTGAFASGGGYPPYFVKCDDDTNPQGDEVRGTLHMLVGFAAVEPGDYLIYRVSQTIESARVAPVSMERFRFAGG